MCFTANELDGISSSGVDIESLLVYHSRSVWFASWGGQYCRQPCFQQASMAGEEADSKSAACSISRPTLFLVYC
jgi:hypothetical protein